MQHPLFHLPPLLLKTCKRRPSVWENRVSQKLNVRFYFRYLTEALVDFLFVFSFLLYDRLWSGSIYRKENIYSGIMITQLMDNSTTPIIQLRGQFFLMSVVGEIKISMRKISGIWVVLHCDEWFFYSNAQSHSYQ